MKIQFHGACRTTTGSMYLLLVNGQRILLECGLFQGRRADAYDRNANFAFDPASIDVAILSHAHIDHCGNFPNLVKKGFRGSIYCTFATHNLAGVMLKDSAKIQEGDIDFLNRIRAREGLPPATPLYTQEDAERAARQFVAVGYDRAVTVADGVKVTFVDAGHMLGSAQVVLDVKENGRAFRYLFSGDVGRGEDPILRDPVRVDNVDFLQIESTYGCREHEERQRSGNEAMEKIEATIQRGGKVIIPAFAVGRTQQVVYKLHQEIRARHLPPVPVYVDSPLAVNATEIHRLHPECFNDEIYRFLTKVANPFDMENLTYVRRATDSMKLADLRGPAIIISASGMAEAGRILHHLRNHIGDPRNLVLFVGYCAENTLGAQILAGKSPVRILGESFEVRAQIARADSLSGHADQHELREYVQNIGESSAGLRQIFVVHGEEDQALCFGEALRKMKPGAEVTVPTRGQECEV